MAKAKKVKEEKTTPEVEQPVVPTTEETTTEPPVVEPEKVEEEIIEEPVPETPADPEPEKPVVVEEPVKNEKLHEFSKPAPRPEMNPDLTKEERIEKYLESKTGRVRMNDFLKSLYPIVRGNEPPHWTRQGEMKQLKLILHTMQTTGKLTVVNNTHLLLGQGYYKGDQEILHHHNLSTVQIEVYGTGQ